MQKRLHGMTYGKTDSLCHHVERKQSIHKSWVLFMIAGVRLGVTEHNSKNKRKHCTVIQKG